MVYPIEWFDHQFNSQYRTSEALRPEVENGTLAPQDYDLACQFFPSLQRHYGKMYGFIAGSFVVALGAAPAGPGKLRWPPSRMLTYATIAGGVGGLFGTMQRAQAHMRFARSLTDREGFRRAIENTYLREEGEKIQLTLPNDRVIQRTPPVSMPQQPRAELGAPDAPVEPEWAAQADTPDASQSTPIPQRAPMSTRRAPEPTASQTRWDEIRRANAKGNAPASSWDTLRQGHEHTRVTSTGAPLSPAAGASLPDSRAPSTAEDDLTAEKARFEALLEAERNIASQDQRRIDSL